MEKVARFFRLPAFERRLFIEALFWCGLARLVILLLPFRIYARLMGKPHAELKEKDESSETNKTLEAATRSSLEEIGRAVRRAGRHAPWKTRKSRKTRCLVEAIAAKRMLKRRKINCRIYLGVARENDRMIAHAWLQSGNIILTGNKNLNTFTVVSIFE